MLSSRVTACGSWFSRWERDAAMVWVWNIWGPTAGWGRGRAGTSGDGAVWSCSVLGWNCEGMWRVEDNQRFRGPAAWDLNWVETPGGNLCKQLSFRACKEPLPRRSCEQADCREVPKAEGCCPQRCLGHCRAPQETNTFPTESEVGKLVLRSVSNEGDYFVILYFIFFQVGATRKFFWGKKPMKPNKMKTVGCFNALNLYCLFLFNLTCKSRFSFLFFKEKPIFVC